MRRKRLIPLPRELEPLAKLIEGLGRTYDTRRVFSDFVEMSAIALSNRVDWRQAEAREARYMQLIQPYEKLEERQAFPHMLAELAIVLDKTERDVFGPLSSSLGMTNARAGQFWTPWSVSYMMAKMMIGGPQEKSGLAESLAAHNFITAADPCVGPGGMPLAFAQAFEEEGYDPKTQLHFSCVDISITCVHMCYVQLALAGVPAVVTHGNSLTNEFQSHWYTPAHVLGGFSRRLSKRGIDTANAAWWAKARVPERIDFLLENQLEVGQSTSDSPSRAVLDAKEAADRAAANPAASEAPATTTTALEETAD